MNSLDEALTALGDTADQVAAHLRAKKITGCRFNACHCPVATYLAQSGVVEKPAVGDKTIGYLADWGDVEVQTPSAVADFINRFDAGEFPDLDARAAGR